MNKIFFLFIIMFLFIACVKKMPTQKDGELIFKSIITDDSNLIPVDSILGYSPVPVAKVTMISMSYFQTTTSEKKYESYSDSSGVVTFKNLAVSDYTLTVEKELTYEDTTVILRANKIVEVYESTTIPDTVATVLSIPSKLIINEIYYCGPINHAFYFFDQFVELYNASNDTVYLDGLLVGRARQYAHPDMETNDFVQAISLFRFPGEPLEGRDYPLAPGEFSVLAGDALDHSLYITNALDLSNADWEFYDQYGGDLDNPAQNISNQLPERAIDFMINLGHNAVILSDGSDWYYGEERVSGNGQYVHFPIETVIDVVEYSSSSESTKEITARLDAGFAGIGMLKYSGKSVERRLLGFDTNNSTLDFVINAVPTPGFQHE